MNHIRNVFGVIFAVLAMVEYVTQGTVPAGLFAIAAALCFQGDK